MKKKKYDIKQVGKDFYTSLKKVAKMLDKEPYEITNSEFKVNDPLNINPWALKEAGGFTNLKKMYFPPDKNIVTETAAKLVNQHRNKLERDLGKEVFLKEEIIKLLKESLKKNPIKFHKVVKKAKKKKKKKRAIVAQFSDSHFGCDVSETEVGKVNSWNWEIAARRLALYVEQIADYKPHYRKDTKLYFCINGDILSGVIHKQEWFANLITTQISGALRLLIQALTFLAQHFDEIEVVCTSGNHARMVHKKSVDRATVHKWDSYETILYVALKEALASHLPNIKFNIPETPYAIFKILGHTYFQTHGDTVINTGNPGNSINMKAISGQINGINASLMGDDHADAVLVGHMHTPTIQLLDSGCYFVMNGCLIGSEPFAQSIGIFGNNPTQVMFETTEEHAIGDMRYVKVSVADKQKRLDKIIEPFKGKY